MLIHTGSDVVSVWQWGWGVTPLQLVYNCWQYSRAWGEPAYLRVALLFTPSQGVPKKTVEATPPTCLYRGKPLRQENSSSAPQKWK